MRRILAALIMLFVVAVPTAAHADTSDFTFDSFHADYTLGRDADGTSRLAVVETIARDFGVDTVIMIPDKYLARNVAAKTGVKVITWEGACEVHERFTAQEIRDYRAAHPGIVVLAHPECPPEVVAEADFAGSTAAMINYVGSHKPQRVVMITECSMSDNVAVEHPQTDFVRPCNLCPHMKRITLNGILHSLQTMTHEVIVDPVIAARARAPIDRMLAVKV